MMREPVEQRGGHLGIAEDAGPFAEGQVGGDDDRRALVELADQVEQKLTAGLGEGQIAQFIQDQEVEPGDKICGASLPFCSSFCIELVHQIDDIEEPASAPGTNAGSGDADGEVGFTGAGAADQDKVALMVEEVAGGEVSDQRFIDVGGFEVELFQFLCQGQLGNGHLVFDRPGLLLAYLSAEQIAPSRQICCANRLPGNE